MWSAAAVGLSSAGDLSDADMMPQVGCRSADAQHTLHCALPALNSHCRRWRCDAVAGC
jgi:hypothetical protein